jgi:O-antigen ligase
LLILANNAAQTWRLLAAGLIVFALAGTAAYMGSDRISKGIDTALSGLDKETNPAKNSIAHRFWIWEGTLRMIQAHPVNGVGARGFRYAFEEFAPEGDPLQRWAPPANPYHTHQLILEIAAETGLVGIAGLILMLVILAVSLLKTDRTVLRNDLAPLVASLAAAWFPLNTHHAIYSSYWSQIVWLLIGLYCAGWASRYSSNNSKAFNSHHT